MIDVFLIGQGGKPSSISVYLGWDRHSAMADFILRDHGLEVPLDYDITTVKECAPVKWSVCDWPERIVIERTTTTDNEAMR